MSQAPLHAQAMDEGIGQMESEGQPKSVGREISHVGVVVEDVEEAARKLEELIGIGPFKILEPQYRDLTYQGKPGRYKIKIGLAKAGAIDIELVQILYGETLYDSFIQRNGYGLHHLGIRTDNIEQSVKEMEAKGFRVVQSGNRPGVKWAYLSTKEETGLVFELHEKKDAA